MHWADVVALNLSRRGTKHIVSTGITPSGEFHIGHLREILTGDMIARAASESGLDVEFIFIVDDADPLRRVYPFLDDEYAKFIGHQIGDIPAPNADGKPDYQSYEDNGWNYADHFLNPFLEALATIGVKPRIVKNLASYKSGKFTECAKIACDNSEEIKEIIERVSGRELPTNWFPWSPLDSNGSLEGVSVTGYEFPLVHYTDKDGNNGSSDLTKGEGKLPWRIDWPAKWSWIGVTCEAFGKDHGASGGSYDTGKEISQLFGYDAPQPLVYEWISLKGKGAMSSSSGNTIGPMEALQLVPPEILRYLIAQSKPNKAIEFDAGMSLVNLADDYERNSSRDFVSELSDETLSRRRRVQIEDAQGAIKLSTIDNADRTNNSSVSFRHLALLAQTKSEDQLVWDSLGLTKNDQPSDLLRDRLQKMRTWISSEHFPDEMKIVMIEHIPKNLLSELSSDEIQVLKRLIELLENCEWTSESISNSIVESAKSIDKSPRLAYNVSYVCLMGSKKGPRLAPILTELPKINIINQLRRCIDSFQ
ncbi:MAG TPA: lysine--tRNA ligase [Candidatus Poseidoniales archaeon]|nr:MAG TPA: lysine--tRNA ligase [Candidatus Poseidoniales archaeon]HII58739.1 lysine--tRNA ligase [Candidatus Poseidoniaceae archaeon]|tara:strand:+ start:5821 stop:7422 length:1602 start_codon:yes stop_codon:yes gene_type:complete